MATAVLTSTPTIIDTMDTTANLVNDTFVLEGDDKVQGVNSATCVLTPSAGSNQEVWVAGSWNFTTAVHLRMWQKNTLSPYLQTQALNGIQIFISDGTNFSYWTVAGGDTYGGGWKQFVVFTGSTPTSTNGTVNLASVTRIGFRYQVHTRPKNAINLWLDVWYYGPGYTVTGGTSGDEIDWSHIAALDKTNAYGIVERLDDIYFLAGDVKIGNGATVTWFKSGQKVQFKSLPVSTTLYNVTFQGSGCRVAINGGSYGAAGTQNYTFNASDSTITTFTLTGVQFNKASGITFSANKTITNSVFDNCGQVVSSTSTFAGNTLTNSVHTGGALLYPTNDSNLSNCTFINNNKGIEYNATSDATTPGFVNMIFDDVSGKFDVNNTSGGAISIALGGTSNANSYTGSLVTFVASATLSMTVINEAGSPIVGAFAYIDDNNQTPFIMNTSTNASGIASVAWTGGSVVGATWRVRKYGFKPYKATSNVPASGTKDIPVTLIVDPQQT